MGFRKSEKFRSRISEELTAEGTDTELVGGTKKTPEMTQHMLTELVHPYKTLTDWENRFVMSVTDQFERNGTISDRQFEVLEKIYKDRTA